MKVAEERLAPLYADVRLYVGNAPAFNRLIKNWEGMDPLGKDNWGACRNRIFKDGGMEIVVWLRTFHDELEWLGVLAHELVHVVDFICEARNISDTEVRGHTMQCLFGRFLWALRKGRK